MSGCSILVLVATIGVDFGWQQTDGGDLEYIVQIEPELLDLIKSGESIVNEIPYEMRGGRRFRIVVGRGTVPREGKPIQPAPIVNVETRTSPPVDDQFETAPAHAPPNPTGGPFAPQSPFPPIPGSLPKMSNQEPDFNALDPPPLKPGVTFDLGAEKSQPPDSKDTASKKPNNEFMPLPPVFEQNEKRPLPIPDPDDTKAEPFKAGNVIRIDEPDINAVLPIPSTPNADSESREFQQASFSSEEKSASGKTKQTFTQPTNATNTNAENANTELEGGSSMSLTVATLLLFGSVGMNVYLGWLARSFYVRYRKIASQLRSGRVLAS